MRGNSPMPLHWGDFLASTANWPGEARGLYLILLGHQWSLGALPGDRKALIALSGYHGNRFNFAWQFVGPKFVRIPDGRLINMRLEDHRQAVERTRVIRRELGKKGAAKRWKPDSNSHSKPDGPAMPPDLREEKIKREVILFSDVSTPVEKPALPRETPPIPVMDKSETIRQILGNLVREKTGR